MLLFELENVKKYQASLQQDIKTCQDSLAEANNWFEIEGKRDENSKAFGKTVRAKMDSILYNHSINKSGTFGVVIYVNYCCWLMSNAESIFGELMDFVLVFQGYMG